MKKLIALASILAISGVAVATTATTNKTASTAQTNATSQPMPPMPQNGAMPMPPQAGQMPMHHDKQFNGERHHERGEGKHARGDERGRGEHGREMSRGGFYDDSTVAKSLAAAQSAKDESKFRITGRLVKQNSKDEFVFKDSTGAEMTVEISPKAWHGETITPNDQITILGEVDKGFFSTDLEVKAIEK